MKNDAVLHAFLSCEKARSGALRADGVALFCEKERIAHWEDGQLIVNPGLGTPAQEEAKTSLVHEVLCRIQREQMLWQLVKPGARPPAQYAAAP